MSACLDADGETGRWDGEKGLVRVEHAHTRQPMRVSDVSARARSARVSLIYLAVGAVATALYFLLPQQAQSWATDAIALTAPIAILVGVHMHRPDNKAAWYSMALGLFLLGTGEIFFSIYENVLHIEAPLPSIADVPYLLAYVPLTLGLVLVVRARRPGRDTLSLIDASIFAVAAGVASWVFLIAPQAAQSGVTPLGKIVSAAYPVADVLLLAVTAAIALTTDVRVFSYRLITASLIAMITADTLYTFAALHDWYSTGSAIDAGWLLSYILWGAAALHPSMRRLTEHASQREVNRFTRRRLAVEALAVLAIPLMLAIEVWRGGATHVPIIVGGSTVASMLVISRMGSLLGDLEAAALHDPLTGLPNRRLLLDRIAQAFRRAERSGGSVAVLFIDLGGFKRVNDELGHEAGDQTLVEIGRRIEETVRRSDTVARLGGDEFVVVCEGLDQIQADALAHRVRQNVAAPVMVGNSWVELHVDLGVAVEMAPAEGDVTQLLDAADRAMYRAKTAARVDRATTEELEA